MKCPVIRDASPVERIALMDYFRKIEDVNLNDIVSVKSMPSPMHGGVDGGFGLSIVTVSTRDSAKTFLLVGDVEKGEDIPETVLPLDEPEESLAIANKISKLNMDARTAPFYALFYDLVTNRSLYIVENEGDLFDGAVLRSRNDLRPVEFSRHNADGSIEVEASVMDNGVVRRKIITFDSDGLVISIRRTGQ